jgi:two-component system, OmpR family, KDP operon response regulator KdpE
MAFMKNPPDEFVLIVDDDADTLLLVGEIVKIAGYQAVMANNFAQATDLVQQGPAVILLDVVMPDNLCDRLVTHLAAMQTMVPVLLMSSMEPAALEDKRRELVNAGINAPTVLNKPFWVDALLSALAEALPAGSTDQALN